LETPSCEARCLSLLGIEAFELFAGRARIEFVASRSPVLLLIGIAGDSDLGEALVYRSVTSLTD
jgi:hypothetical protein